MAGVSDIQVISWQIGRPTKRATSGPSPLGLSVSKVVKFDKLPVRFALACQYMVHHPDVGGQKWNIQLMVVPVIPKLIKGTLFDD
jgi:hypothetical protein